MLLWLLCLFAAKFPYFETLEMPLDQAISGGRPDASTAMAKMRGSGLATPTAAETMTKSK